jgi:hypothetical protein
MISNISSRQMWGQREAERAPVEMMSRAPVAAYDRRPAPSSGYGDMGRSYAERPQAAPAAMSGYDRRPMYEARPAADMYSRRSPPPPSAGYGAMGGG